MLTQEDKDYIGEMFARQTKTLIEYVDGVEKRLTRKMVDLRGDMIAETRRQIEQHVVTQHG